MTIFDQVNDLCDIIRVAEYYGVTVKRGKASCPFHNEKAPSMSFKNNRYRCFGCGAGGDCVDLVARLHNISPIEAVKQLNDDFNCGLDVDKPLDGKAIAERKRQQELYEIFTIWENDTFKQLCNKLHALKKTIAKSKPFSDEWCISIRARELIGYYLDILTNGSFNDRFNLYKQLKDGEKNIEQKRSSRRTGTTFAG